MVQVGHAVPAIENQIAILYNPYGAARGARPTPLCEYLVRSIDLLGPTLRGRVRTKARNADRDGEECPNDVRNHAKRLR